MWCHHHNVEEEGTYRSLRGQCWRRALHDEPCDPETPPEAPDEWRAPTQPDQEQN